MQKLRQIQHEYANAAILAADYAHSLHQQASCNQNWFYNVRD